MTPFSYPQLFCLLTPFCHSLRLSLLGSCCWVKIFSFAFLGDCTNIATRGEVLTHNWHPQGPACRRLWLSHLSFFLSFFFDWGWSCLISTPNVIFRTFEENLFRKWNKMKKKKDSPLTTQNLCYDFVPEDNFRKSFLYHGNTHLPLVLDSSKCSRWGLL